MRTPRPRVDSFEIADIVKGLRIPSQCDDDMRVWWEVMQSKQLIRRPPPRPPSPPKQ